MKRRNLNLLFILFLGLVLISGGINKAAAKSEKESGNISISSAITPGSGEAVTEEVRIESQRLEQEQTQKLRHKKDIEKQDARNKKELENQESKKIKAVSARQTAGREAVEKKEAKIGMHI